MGDHHVPGARFLPTDLGLVRSYLRKKVNSNMNGFIRTMNVYATDPWLLDHDPNPLYKRNIWYYFVERTKRGTTAIRKVKKSNESEGGTWKSTTSRKEICDVAGKLHGYKQCFVYNVAVNEKAVKTDWLMDEYTLCGEGFQRLALCRIKYKEKNVDKKQQQQPLNNNGLSNQEQEFANELEDMMVVVEEEEEEEHGIQPSTLLPPPTTGSNNNNNYIEDEDMLAKMNDLPLWGDDGFDLDLDLDLDLDFDLGVTSSHDVNMAGAGEEHDTQPHALLLPPPPTTLGNNSSNILPEQEQEYEFDYELESLLQET